MRRQSPVRAYVVSQVAPYPLGVYNAPYATIATRPPNATTAYTACELANMNERTMIWHCPIG